MAHLGGDIVGSLGRDRGCAGTGRGDHVGNGRQLLVLDDDAVDGVARRFARFRDDAPA